MSKREERKASWSGKPVKWGYTSYRRVAVVRKDKRKYYSAHLQSVEAGLDYTVLRITFWARRPIIALRAICAHERSAKDMEQFDGQVLN